MKYLCLDFEGVLIPEIWQYVAKETGSKEPVKHPLIEEIFSGKKGSSYFKISN